MPKVLWTLYKRYGTWRAVAQALDGYSAAYWCAVAHGRWEASRRAENLLRRHLRLAPRGVTRWFDMRASDLAWYLENRQVVDYDGFRANDAGDPFPS